MAGNFDQKLRTLVEPIVESYGYSLWGLRYRVGRNNAHLQIFIENENGGVDADACGDITNALSPVLDTADLIDPAYILEVSSPGVDRILFTQEQLAKYVGQQIKVELSLASLGRRRYEGKLVSCADDGSFVLEDKNLNEKVELAFANVSIARVVPDFSTLVQGADA